jgi:hypothetical protein
VFVPSVGCMQVKQKTALGGGEMERYLGDLCMRCTHSFTALLTGRANERRYMSRLAGSAWQGQQHSKTKIHAHVPSQAVNGHGRLYR